MATIAISCPKCENQIKVPPNLEGKKIRCKECAYVFVVKVPPGAKAAAAKAEKADKKAGKEKQPAAQADEDGDANPYQVTVESHLPHCAYCAKEMESEEQVICLHCGYNHRTRERIQTEKTYEPTAGEWIIHLLPGILCALVVLLVLGDIAFTWINRTERFADYEAAHAEAWVNPFALSFAIWRTVIGLFIGFAAGRFAVKRLILNTRPPERQMAKRKKAIG